MLSKPHRLPASEISRVMQRGRRVVGDGVTLIYTKTKMDSGSMAGMTARISFIVSTKVDKRATARNRVRRLLSESVRLHFDSVPLIDAVVIGSKTLLGLSQTEVETRVTQILGKIK